MVDFEYDTVEMALKTFYCHLTMVHHQGGGGVSVTQTNLIVIINLTIRCYAIPLPPKKNNHKMTEEVLFLFGS
jgi:hypothetical protein